MTIEELKDHLNFLVNDMQVCRGGVECWLDLYRKEFRELYGYKPTRKQLLNYITDKN